MQTVGYWCDECRQKYVRHACKGGLPCGHSKDDAIFVYAKYYATGGEFVSLSWSDDEGDHEREMWISRKEHDQTWYLSGSRELWGHIAQVEKHIDAGDKININMRDLKPCAVGAWLHVHSEKIVRAYMMRWESHKEPPVWRQISTIPEDSTLLTQV
jgi:hypothetical protein